MERLRRGMAFLLALTLLVTCVPECIFAAGAGREPERMEAEETGETGGLEETTESGAEDLEGFTEEPDPEEMEEPKTSEEDTTAAVPEKSEEPEAAESGQEAGVPVAYAESSFSVLTVGQTLHHTNPAQEIYRFKPEESGWYHLVIESQECAFTAGVYQRIHYNNSVETSQNFYQDINYKDINVTKSDHIMWLNSEELYDFFCIVTTYEDPELVDAALTMKQADISGLEAVSAPAEPSFKAFIGTGMQVKINYKDSSDFTISSVTCSSSVNMDGSGFSTNRLDALRWNGIAYRTNGQYLSDYLEVRALDGNSDQTDVSVLSPGEHTVTLGLPYFADQTTDYYEFHTAFSVVADTIESIEVIEKTDTYTQYFGEMLKPIKLKITYNDGTPVKTIDSSDSGEYVEQYLYIGEYEGSDGATWPHVTPSIDDYLSNGKTPGEAEVTVKYQGVTTSYPITIRENPYNGISVSAGKKIYYANSGYTEHGQNFKGESISLSDVGSIVLSRKDGTADDTYRSLTAIPGNEYYLHGNYGINYGGKYYKDIDAYIAAGGSYGEVNVTVSYLDYEAVYPVEIRENPYESIELIQQPTKITYTSGYYNKTLNLEGLVMKANKKDGGSDTFTYGENGNAALENWSRYLRSFSEGYWYLNEGTHTAYVVFMNMSAEYQIEVVNPDEPEQIVYTEIEILKPPARTVYYVGEQANYGSFIRSAEGMELKLTNSKGEVKQYRYWEYTQDEIYESWYDINDYINVDWNQIDWAKPGTYPVTVICSDRGKNFRISADFEVTVADSPVTSFELISAPKKDTYFRYEGSEMYLDGLSYKITFDDGSLYANTIVSGGSNPSMNVTFQGRSYSILKNWQKRNSDGNPTYGENGFVFTLFGTDYPMDQITILEDPAASVQFVKHPDKMLYFGNDRTPDLYGAKIRINYTDEKTEELEITEHTSQVTLDTYGKTLTAELVETPYEEDGNMKSKKNIHVTYMNASVELPVELEPSKLDVIPMKDGGQSSTLTLDEEHPYQIFSFTPTATQYYYFYCINAEDGYGINGYVLDLYEGKNQLFGNYFLSGWDSPFYGYVELTAGRTYYYIVTISSDSYVRESRLQCYLSSKITDPSKLGEVKGTELDYSSVKKIWYDFETDSGLQYLSTDGLSYTLEYDNGHKWTETRYCKGSSMINNQYVLIDWRDKEQNESGMSVPKKGSNALLYTYGEQTEEVPVQVGAASPVSTITIDNNPYQDCYMYQYWNGTCNMKGLSVTVNYKDGTKKTLVWKDDNYSQRLDGYDMLFTMTKEESKDSGDMIAYRMEVNYMGVTAEKEIAFLADPVTGFELKTKPQKNSFYPFDPKISPDLYGMEFAVAYRNGTKETVTVSNHGSSVKLTKDAKEAVTGTIKQENGDYSLYLKYQGCEAKVMDYDSRPLPMDEAAVLDEAQAGYTVLTDDIPYAVYRFCPSQDGRYTFKTSGPAGVNLHLYDADGAKLTSVSNKNLIQSNLSEGETVYLAAVKTAVGRIGSLCVTVSNEELVKTEVASVEITALNPTAGTALPEVTLLQGSGGYEITSCQWYGDQDGDDIADFAAEYRIRVILSCDRDHYFSANTQITFNGTEITAKTLESNGTISLYYTFPYTECSIELPEVEGYTLYTDGNEKTDRAAYGGEYRFRYADASGASDTSLIVKANHQVLSLDESGYYVIRNIRENIRVIVKSGDLEAGEGESRLAFHNRSDALYDVIIGMMNRTIKENENGENSLPEIESYTEGSDQFFYGWYLGKNADYNGIGTRFTSISKIEKASYDLYAKWGSGIFSSIVKGKPLAYQALSFDEYNKMTVQVNGIDKKTSGVEAVGAEEANILEIPSTLQQDQMLMEEDLGIAIESCQVVAVADYAFAKETDIQAVILPETVERIGANAFADCTSLEEIRIPNGVTEIGENAFEGCTSLHEIVIPATVTELRAGTFRGCDTLTVTLQDTMAVIDPAAFADAERVTIVCSSQLAQTAPVQELIAEGAAVQTVDLILNHADGKKFSYDDDGERFTAVVRVDGTEQTNRTLHWQYAQTDAYAYQAADQDLIVTPLRVTAEEEEILLTVVDMASHVEKTITLHTVAADLGGSDENGVPLYVAEVSKKQNSGENSYPVVTVKRNTPSGKVLSASDYEVAYTDSEHAGMGRVVVTGKGNYTGTIQQDYALDKRTQEVTAQDIVKTIEDFIFSLKASTNGDGILSYTSSNPKVAAIDAYGVVVIRGIGVTTISIQASETELYYASPVKTITLTVKPKQSTVLPPTEVPGGSSGGTADQTVNKPDLKVSKTSYTKAYGSKPFKLGASAGSGITYKSSKPSVASVTSAGTVTVKKCGKTVITVKAGKEEKKVTIRVVPKKASKVRAVSRKAGELAISWSRQKEAAGYVVEYSKDKKFKKNVYRKLVKKNKTTSVKVKKLSKGKKYYVRVKAYTTIDKMKVYGTASKAVNRKVKK